MPGRRTPLTIDKILAWADAHHERTGRWPSKYSGTIHATRGETWSNVNSCLANGRRGLPGGSSISRLLGEYRGRLPGGPRRSKLAIEQILAWADEHHARTARWPSFQSGEIPGSGGEKWNAIQQALYLGLRGLRGGSSLAKLLVEHRGAAAGRHYAPPLSVDQILEWADAHFRRTGVWPRSTSGAVFGAPDEHWQSLNSALRRGSRGLPGQQSLALLLWRHRGVRPFKPGVPLSIDQILAWADEHHRLTGRWPQSTSGDIPGIHGEAWSKVDQALRNGSRGLPKGSSLARLLRERRGVGCLTVEQILTWADHHQCRTGRWPQHSSGAVVGASGEQWSAIDLALRNGSRGLPGNDSLSRLLAGHRGVTAYGARPPLTVDAILAWADAHHRRTGWWPCTTSGPVEAAAGETWGHIDQTLRNGGRGLDGGTTLAKLLHKHRGAPRRGSSRTLLTRDQIVAWINAFHRRTGQWPKLEGGPVTDAPGETWRHFDYVLRNGRRGLRGRLSLRELVARCQKRHKRKTAPPVRLKE